MCLPGKGSSQLADQGSLVLQYERISNLTVLCLLSRMDDRQMPLGAAVHAATAIKFLESKAAKAVTGGKDHQEL